MSRRHHLRAWAVALTSAAAVAASVALPPAASATTLGPLHTTGTNSVMYDATNTPVRLIGFNWTGTEAGGRADNQKIADVCGNTWRTPADKLNGIATNTDDMYANIKAWGYNVIRLPISWNDLEPVAPVWNATTNAYTHTWNQTYINDIKSMVTKANTAGVGVILDMHQDYWSPALHHITNWDGSTGYCEGAGMPRWLDPSIDAKASTTQLTDFYNGMNWFYRNVNDPSTTLTHASPWQFMYSAWDQLSYIFSSHSGFAAYQAVVGADILNEPYIQYVGGNPPAGQTVLQAAGSRLLSFYNALAPAVTHWAPSWLLFFQDGTGGYNTAAPASRETPTMTAKPSVAGNWVYSSHIYNFGYGTFDDGVAKHSDYGVTVANAQLANATAWKVPMYVGEFTNFTLGKSARTLTTADMVETGKFLSWAKTNNVSWTFWAYMNPYLPMTVVDYANNQPIAVVKTALDAGR